MAREPTEREALPEKSQLRILPASSRYSRLLLSPLSPGSRAPDWKSWYIPGDASGSVSTPYCEAADPIPLGFEPVPAPRSFKIPADVHGNLRGVGDLREAEIYSPGDKLPIREQKQEEFWEWEQEHTLREKRWRERFGNPHTPLGQLQIALKSSIETRKAETALGSLPEWVNGSMMARVILFYPPVLERLVRFLDLQALLGIMGTSVVLRRVFLEYPLVWKHISFAVWKRGSAEERDVAMKEDLARYEPHYGAWAGSRLRFTSGLLRLGSSKVASFGMEARILSSLPLVGLRVLILDGSAVAGRRAFYDVLRITRSTLEVLSVRFCKLWVEDVERILVSCAARGTDDDDDGEEEDEGEEDEDEDEDGTQYCFTKDPTCALKKIRIWGIQGGDSHHIPKTTLPVELKRSYIASKAKFDKALEIDQRKFFINGMFYIPHSISKKAPRYNLNPASQDATGRLIVIARQLGIETDFEDCDTANNDCWNSKQTNRRGSEWKVGIPGLRIERKCSGCTQRKLEVMCRNCEEHRTCFWCKRVFCRACNVVSGYRCDRCTGKEAFYCDEEMEEPLLMLCCS